MRWRGFDLTTTLNRSAFSVKIVAAPDNPDEFTVVVDTPTDTVTSAKLTSADAHELYETITARMYKSTVGTIAAFTTTV
jgi:hypothetical protein